MTVPVVEATLGRLIDVNGNTIDKGKPLTGAEHWPIHRPAPAFDELDPTDELFETGIKVVDLLAPYVKGGKIGLFGGAGVGKTVIVPDSSTTSPRSTAATRCSAAWASAPARATTSGPRCRSPAFWPRPRSSSAR